MDFVLYGGSGFYAIEVKNNSSIRPEDLRGLWTFLQDYPEASALFLYRGEETLERGVIRCMPIETYLTKLIPGKELPRRMIGLLFTIAPVLTWA